MQEIDALKAAFGKFLQDFGTFSTDVQKKLADLGANQVTAADKQTVADITTALGSMDDAVNALEGTLNPQAPPPPPPPPAVG